MNVGVSRSNPLGSGGLRVVLYHHLTDRPGEFVDRLRMSTPPGLFEAHLERFARDYELVCLDDVLSGQLPKRALLITFDDGYRSVIDVAGPLLKKHGLPSVFFISSAFVRPDSLPLDNLLCLLSHRIGLEKLESAVTGRPAKSQSFTGFMGIVAGLAYERRTTLGDELAECFGVDRAQLRRDSGLFLDHTELRRLSELGMEVGNHTRSHLHCRAITDQAVACAELVEHQRELEEWSGAPVRSFSYPYGSPRDANPLVERVLMHSGHQALFLVDARPNARGHRGSTWHRVSLQDQPTSRLYLELAVLPQLRAVKDLLKRAPA